jgi:hypothetical protein
MTKVVNLNLNLNLAGAGKALPRRALSRFRIDNVIACGWRLRAANGGMWGMSCKLHKWLVILTLVPITSYVISYEDITTILESFHKHDIRQGRALTFKPLQWPTD